MLQKFTLVAQVLAINSKGDTANFELEKPVSGEIEPSEKEKELFFGEKFRGRKDGNDPCDFVVTQVKRVECVPEPFYVSVMDSGTLDSPASIRLGNYDDPDDLNPSYRKSPLTGLTVNFEMRPGDGVIFNRRDRFGWVTPSRFRWTKNEYVVTRWQDEIWTFPKSGWELHLSPTPDVDYVDPDDFRDSLPEITSW